MLYSSRQIQWEEITKKISEILYPLGFDLVKAFPIQRYNSNVSPASSLAPLPTYFRTSTLSIIVGNTKHLWPIFLKYYTKFQSVTNNTKTKPINAKCKSRSNSHEKKFVAFQRLTQDAGLAYYNKSCFLCVHEEFGPWFGLRAVITFDIEGPPNESYLFPPLKNPYPEGDALLKLKITEILGTENHNYHQLVTPTHSSDSELTEIKPVFDDDDKKKFMNSRDNAKWYEWVELRDIASGFMTKDNLEKYRYSEEQIKYHYTHNLKFLQELCKKLG
ncbi:10400_t:CDS:2 [Gigaspora rosea]|nr:10400_t:CDS:2 [Gigaspora rosea]